ncbi:hypothetical protein AND_000411 [Anopheles darlingi]|uniref:Uncharacterized protein n=2 Tax=Anopheles darlingi TaxID=43151 RepID=W5JUD9_ANODA|nr:hypothetical protein AND_000411 [Anopheles darlingi]
MIKQGMQSEKEAWKSMKPDYLSAWTLIFAFFILVFNFVFLETLATPLTMDMFAWTKAEALYYMAWIMAVGAVLASGVFLMIGPLCKRIPEQHVLLWGGFFLMVLGRAVYIPMSDQPPKLAIVENVTATLFQAEDPNWKGVYGSNFTDVQSDMVRVDLDYKGPAFVDRVSNLSDTVSSKDLLGCPSTQEWCKTTRGMTIFQFLLGYAFTAIGYPIGVTLITTIFSKVLGPRPQGTWMGLMTGSGCMSRALGPVFLSTIYTKYGLYWTFGSTAVMMAITMLWLWHMRQRLAPASYESKDSREDELATINFKQEDSTANQQEHDRTVMERLENWFRPRQKLKDRQSMLETDEEYCESDNISLALFAGDGFNEWKSISNNGLNFIADRALEGLVSLSRLDISQNRITNLPPELFSEAKHIEEIYLQNNSLNVLAPGIFTDLQQLHILDLSNNELTSEWINPSTFKGLLRLILLDLTTSSKPSQ